uniref:Reverse transcriptase domain-containing protein n=1 Tax=Rhabditophanes sp. KR3021 TaxID=114890 RepID=A0AC35UFF1_9BILA
MKTMWLKKKAISSLKDKSGFPQTNPFDVNRIACELYSEICADPDLALDDSSTPSANSENVSPITRKEVADVLKYLNIKKACGLDGITSETLKPLSSLLAAPLADRLNRYLVMEKTPTAFKRAELMLLFKKGDKEDIGNYRPLSLLSIPLKVYTKIILSRLEERLDSVISSKQAGFRKHLHNMFMVFLDLKKAFDMISRKHLFAALRYFGFEEKWMRMIDEL